MMVVARFFASIYYFDEEVFLHMAHSLAAD
jgi:hypothetical protein